MTVTEEIKTGADVLRRAVRARRHKAHLGLLARDLNVPIGDLEDFADAKRELAMPILQKLAKELHDAEIDPESGLLRQLNRREPRLAGIPPPPYRHSPHQYPPPYKPSSRFSGFTGGPPSTPGRLAKGPGWLGD
jgi:hypothetical protein